MNPPLLGLEAALEKVKPRVMNEFVEEFLKLSYSVESEANSLGKGVVTSHLHCGASPMPNLGMNTCWPSASPTLQFESTVQIGFPFYEGGPRYSPKLIFKERGNRESEQQKSGIGKVMRCSDSAKLQKFFEPLEIENSKDCGNKVQLLEEGIDNQCNNPTGIDSLVYLITNLISLICYRKCVLFGVTNMETASQIVASDLWDLEWSQRVRAVEEALEALSVVKIITLFFLFCEVFLEREVRCCKDNRYSVLGVLATSRPFPIDFPSLFETAASAVLEVSIGDKPDRAYEATCIQNYRIRGLFEVCTFDHVA
ncbi:hypothetical protein SUGI_0318670 [Cryptomeria japonica]|nr:hypothetical protein SUGI_0318670 [Cryptomeria japonica]